MKCGSANPERREFLKILGLACLAPAIIRPSIANAFVRPGSWHERMRPLMATFVSVAIHHQSEAQAAALIDQCFAFIEAKVSELSSWDANSAVSKLSDSRSSTLSILPESVRRLCAAAQAIESQTSGSFKLLISPLTELWRQAREQVGMPEASEVASALGQLENSRLGVSRSKIQLYGAGRIDVGGIGKGLIADLAAEFLQFRGVRYARIACSGDLRFIGDGPWEVEVSSPDGEGLLRTLRLRGNPGVSTSGTSENFWYVNQRKLHHLINPLTGYPADYHQQATVIAPSAVAADGLATALFCLPEDAALAVLRRSPEISGLLVDPWGKVQQS